MALWQEPKRADGTGIAGARRGEPLLSNKQRGGMYIVIIRTDAQINRKALAGALSNCFTKTQRYWRTPPSLTDSALVVWRATLRFAWFHR